jgi:hypothetical protein
MFYIQGLKIDDVEEKNCACANGVCEYITELSGHGIAVVIGLVQRARSAYECIDASGSIWWNEAYKRALRLAYLPHTRITTGWFPRGLVSSSYLPQCKVDLDVRTFSPIRMVLRWKTFSST